MGRFIFKHGKIIPIGFSEGKYVKMLSSSYIQQNIAIIKRFREAKKSGAIFATHSPSGVMAAKKINDEIGKHIGKKIIAPWVKKMRGIKK